MLLTKLRLTNIRSYSSQEIEFTQGSTLLAGDIGAGKSSILFAIEFALFGTSRPDLPGDHLLRKGTTQGMVELHFTVQNISYIINRSLKKDKNGVKQTTGFLITNGIKKELTAQELKSAIVNILGYPADVVSKNKNYIFHYTIYTPQESMKLILQDNADIRLNVLRKIFNIDKYKIIRDNISLYCKNLRLQIARLEGEASPLEELEQQLQARSDDKQAIQERILKKTPIISELEKQHTQTKIKIQEIAQKQEKRKELLSKIQESNARIEEKENIHAKLALQHAQVQKEIETLTTIDESTEILKEKINKLEIEKETLIRNSSSLSEQIRSLQSQITTLQQTQKQEQIQLEKRDEKKKELEKVTQNITQLQETQGTKEQLQELLTKTQSIITRNTTLLEESNKLQEKISGLDSCPTCKQTVTTEHKNQICTQENEKISKAQNLLFEARKKAQQISDQLEKLNQGQKTILEMSNRKTRLELEIIQAGTLEQKINERKEQIKNLVQENNVLMNKVKEQDVEVRQQEYTTKINDLRQILQKKEQHEKILKRNQEITTEIEESKKQVGLLQFKVQNLKKELEGIEDRNEDLVQLQQQFEQQNTRLQEEKVSLARLQTTKEEIEKQQQELNIKVEKLRIIKTQFIKKREIHFWLEEHFIKLTYAIEKQVMIRIHNLFNELFQDWFNILLDDENLYARIDDSFSPILEQNGYEIEFNNLSGGEKTSVSLAYRLALNRVINDVIHEIKTKDLLILDEPTDGFSTEQLDKVRDVLERLNLAQTILVSHENKIESFVENVIRVHKRGHVSEVN